MEACKKKFNNQLDILLESMYGGQIQQTEEPGKGKTLECQCYQSNLPDDRKLT